LDDAVTIFAYCSQVLSRVSKESSLGGIMRLL
jgi:hypothetical protein